MPPPPPPGLYLQFISIDLFHLKGRGIINSLDFLSNMKEGYNKFSCDLKWRGIINSLDLLFNIKALTSSKP
jgi:hypothetical protein